MYKFIHEANYGANRTLVSVEDEVEDIFSIGSLFGQFLENTGFSEVTIQRIMPNYSDCKCYNVVE